MPYLTKLWVTCKTVVVQVPLRVANKSITDLKGIVYSYHCAAFMGE